MSLEALKVVVKKSPKSLPSGQTTLGFYFGAPKKRELKAEEKKESALPTEKRKKKHYCNVSRKDYLKLL
jgi:hypothetical protein